MPIERVGPSVDDRPGVHEWTDRRRALALLAGWGLACVSATGCAAPWFKRTAKSELETQEEAVRDVLASEARPRLVGDAATLIAAETREYEGYGLISGLAGTGGDVKPSSQRDFILREMRANKVDNPNQILASKQSALVMLKTFVPTGSTKGDTLDVIVEQSEQCEATSLWNGRLMPARMQEMMLLGGGIRSSELKAKAQGPLVIIPPHVIGAEQVNVQQARILGGATLQESRRFSFRVKESLRHVATCAAVSRALNDRYSFQDGSQRKGIATSRNDSLISIEIPSKYRWDMQHYTDLLMAVPFLEASEDQTARIASCARRLTEPTAARQAALELEAIGKAGIEALRQGLAQADPELRYYAAYSLAYLDDAAATPVLGQLAIDSAELRPLCLLGLQVSNDPGARDQLQQLLHREDPEVRYGALLALRRRHPLDAIYQGQKVGELCRLVNIPSDLPLVVVSLEERPEIVVFGGNCPVKLDRYHEVNPRFTLRPGADGQLMITHFMTNQADIEVTSSGDLASILQAFHQAEATYNDIVWWLNAAREQTWVAAPIVLNPRPQPGRSLTRGPASTETQVADASTSEPLAADETDKSSFMQRWWGK